MRWHGITSVKPKPRSDKGKTHKMTPEEVLEAIEQVRPSFRGPHNVTAFYRTCIERGLLRRERIAPSTAVAKEKSVSVETTKPQITVDSFTEKVRPQPARR